MPRPPTPKPARRSPGTGSVIRRRDGRIAAILPADLDPRRRPRYGPAKGRRWAAADEARAWLDAEVRRLRAPPEPRSATLAEPLGAYLARWHRLHRPRWPPRTARVYRQALRLVVSIGDVPLGELTHETIQGALSELAASTWRRRRRDGSPTSEPRPYSRRTVALVRTTLHQALGELVPQLLPYNPVARTRLGRAQEPERPVWDADEADRFLAAVEGVAPDLALAFVLILRRGLRRGEVLALRWADVDERRGVLTVAGTAGDHAGDVGDTKGRRAREIPLSPELLARLREHRARQTTLSPWLFVNAERRLPWGLGKLGRVADLAIGAAGLPRVTVRDLRATCATILLDEGIALARVSRLLGHSNASITAQHYERALRAREERLERIAAELDGAFARASEAARSRAPASISGDTGR